LSDRQFSTAPTAGTSRIQNSIDRWRQNDNGMLAAFGRTSSRPILTGLPHDYRPLTDARTLVMPLTGSSNHALL
jgi:hypothetical protein